MLFVDLRTKNTASHALNKRHIFVIFSVAKDYLLKQTKYIFVFIAFLSVSVSEDNNKQSC